MTLAGFLEVLTRHKTESDPGFRRELQEYARRGLLILGCVSLGLSSIAVVSKALDLDYPHSGDKHWWPSLVFYSMGATAVIVSRRKALARWARTVGYVIGLMVLVFTLFLDLTFTHGVIGEQLTLNILTILLIGVVTLPITPLQAIFFNSFAVISWYIAWQMAASAGFTVPANLKVMPLAVVASLCVVLYIVNYERLLATYKAHKAALDAMEELRQSEVRTCHAENASTHLRLAAALSHELNTPMGALRSSVDTVVTAASRLPREPLERQERLAGVIEDAREVAEQAITRLESVVRRMQRFTNLDRADVQTIDLKSMWTDIVDLHAPAAGTTRIETHFDSAPSLTGQPQALSSIFSTLLKRALDSVDSGGLVSIRITGLPHSVRILLDHGEAPGSTGFDLDFSVDHDRVGAANWDLYSARQVIRSHGGEIEAASASGIVITLPAHPRSVAAAS